jgi:microsomal dipeptidase-like Zn-dependent dipeptidase
MRKQAFWRGPWLALVLTGCGDQSPEEIRAIILENYAAPTETKNPFPPASQYVEIHAGATVVDTHADTLLMPDEGPFFERLLSNPDRDGHVDVPRLIQGNVTLQTFSVASKASADNLGNSFPELTGGCDFTPDCSRHDFERDPNVPEYDDPLAPYQAQFDVPPLYLRRDLYTYAYKLFEHPCRTWFGTDPWDPIVWPGTPQSCADYVEEREYLERLLVSAKRLRDAALVDSRLRVIRSRSELNSLLAARAVNKNRVGGLLSTEGLYFRSQVQDAAGQNRLRRFFAELYNAGFRMFAMTHFIDSDHGGSSTGMGNAFATGGRGLSDQGRFFSELSFTHGAVVDVAHASKATISDLVQLANARKKPILHSHGGLSQLFPDDERCANARNLTDQQVVEIASTGGVVNLGFSEDFVCDSAPSVWALAVRHAVDVIDTAQVHRFGDPAEPVLRGADHVGIGSDFDGGVETYTDVAHLVHYTRALVCQRTFWTPSCLERPFTTQEAYKIMGLNTLRVLQEALPATTVSLPL